MFEFYFAQTAFTSVFYEDSHFHWVNITKAFVIHLEVGKTGFKKDLFTNDVYAIAKHTLSHPGIIIGGCSYFKYFSESPKRKSIQIVPNLL